MSSQIKIDHHFLPKVYLKGFSVDDSDKLFVMNKKWGNIRSMSPTQIMYQKHLYTVNEYENPQLIEDFYSSVENELSGAFELIDELRHKPDEYVKLKESREFHKLVKLIIAFQFWRAPKQNELAKTYADNLIEIYKGLTEQTKSSIGLDEEYIYYLYNNRSSESHIKVIQHIILPVVTFKIYDDEFIDFYVYVTHEETGLVLTCDNPVIYYNLNDLFSFKAFAFPLSKNMILGSGSIDHSFTIGKFNEVIVKQASERIVGASKLMLENLKEYCRN